MASGQFRCDVNVSVRKKDNALDVPLGTKVEVKNLNSFNSMQRAVDFEARRQIAIIEGIDFTVEGVMERHVFAETRLWDESAQITRSMRKKETLADYRYVTLRSKTYRI